MNIEQTRNMHRGRAARSLRQWLGGFAALLLSWAFATGAAQAASVKGLDLLAGGAGVRIALDAPAEYQVYELEAPARLVLMFPDGKLAKGVRPLRGAGVIAGVNPVRDQRGARIEITLNHKARYAISESGNDVVLRFDGASPAAMAQAAKKAVITSVTARDVGDVTELVIRGRHLDANHNAYLTDHGRQLIVDIWGGESKLPQDHYLWATQRISALDVGAADGRVRLVAKLLPTEGMAQQIEASSDRLVVRVGKLRRAAAAARSGVTVEDVNFRPDDRIAHILVRTDKPNPVFNISATGKVVRVDLAHASLAPGKERSLDVSAFPGPVRQVDSYRKGDSVRVVARLREDVEVTSFQSGNVLTINLVPKDLALARRGELDGEKSPYTGDRVTFDFKDIDIRNALKLIAEMSDLNIIMSDDVSGTLTMRLVDVPWDQALDLILSARGLGKERIGNVLRIAPMEVLQADAEAKRKALLSVEDVAPLETEFIRLGYASVNDVKTILEGGSLQDNGAQGSGKDAANGAAATAADAGAKKGGLKLLSKRGSILMDERSNMLIITDTRERLNNIKRLIAMIDKPVQQVLIEARIVEASDNFSRDLGIRWGGAYNNVRNKRFPNTVVVGPATGNNFIVDLPAAAGPGTGGAIGLQMGSLSGVLNLNLELSAAEADGRAKIISSPRVITSNLKPAVISQGTDIPFQSSSANNGTNVQFKQAQLKLEVTPQVTADHKILMQVLVTKDSPQQAAVGGNPLISTRKVQTEIAVDNGATVVIGGIYTKEKGVTENGVPLFKDIPLLGWLFKKKQITDRRTELLIFLTPTIISDKRNDNLASVQ